MKEGYYGWTNWETWNVGLWLGFDTYQMIRAWADDMTVAELAENIKGYCDETNPIADRAGLHSDLLRAALDKVNWIEIAENIKDE